MGRLLPLNDGAFQAVPMAIGLFISVSALLALCAKHAIRAPGKSESKTSNSPIAPRSPMLSPGHLLTTLSSKTIPFLYKKKIAEGLPELGGRAEAEEFGADGLWQKTILMGGKCQPPDFSGVIYYDSYGKQSELPPRSPRASPLPSFTFPVRLPEKEGK